MNFRLPVIFYKDPETEYIVVSCPVVNVVTQGKNIEDAKKMIKEAVELALPDDDWLIDMPYWDEKTSMYMEMDFEAK